ncbi:hypothetical protein, partial [Nocardia sp. NPDC004750]
MHVGSADTQAIGAGEGRANECSPPSATRRPSASALWGHAETALHLECDDKSESCAAIVWNDPAAAPEAAAALSLTARDLLRLGVVDAVLPEPGDDVGAAPVA